MKRFAILAVLAAAIAVGGSASANQQGSPATAQLTVVHAATYDAGNEFPVTVCLDGGVVDDDFRVGEQIGPVDLPGGTYLAEVFGGAGGDCSGSPAISSNISLNGGDDITVVATWNNEGLGAATFENDRSCIEAGSAKVRAVHAATAGTVDVYASAAGEPPAAPAAIPDFAEGTVAGPLTVPAAAYDVALFPAGADPSGTPALAVPGVTLAEGTVTTIYAIGGNDGDIGAFALVDQVDVCEEETTTTTVEETTTTTAPTGQAPAATPVQGTASYTG